MIPDLDVAALGLGMILAGVQATTAINHGVAGIEIIVNREPDGRALVVGRTNQDGWYRGPVPVEAGSHQVSASCPPRRQCPSFRLAIVQVNGRTIGPNARGQHVFPVGPGGAEVQLEARVLDPSVAPPPLRPVANRLASRFQNPDKCGIACT